MSVEGDEALLSLSRALAVLLVIVHAMVDGGGICLMQVRGQSRVPGTGLYCSPLTALRQALSLKQTPAVSSSLTGCRALRVHSSTRLCPLLFGSQMHCGPV